MREGWFDQPRRIEPRPCPPVLRSRLWRPNFDHTAARRRFPEESRPRFGGQCHRRHAEESIGRQPARVPACQDAFGALCRNHALPAGLRQDGWRRSTATLECEGGLLPAEAELHLRGHHHGRLAGCDRALWHGPALPPQQRPAATSGLRRRHLRCLRARGLQCAAGLREDGCHGSVPPGGERGVDDHGSRLEARRQDREAWG
mmetsp:Transcript_3507/g.8708  ORF Transcript_3507/g.8708 Transcript_3507/m.8708 type:complete len:202 (+) Transcript_3507:151-756(+)